MRLIIREGTIQEALEVEHQIPEFEKKRTIEDYKNQLSRTPTQILVAEEAGRLVACKVGYKISNDEFYSWLGGVIPAYRNQKIATALREEQERWATQIGYKLIRVDSYNKYSSMICMLISSGYLISSFEIDSNPLKSRIGFYKELLQR
jgi:predicted GNAT superfamily acetyltransferase